MKPICPPTINNGNYFLHHSLLQEASESWLQKKGQTNSGIFIMHLIFSRIKLEICTCDRTLKKLSETGHTLAFTPALYDTINKKSIFGYDNLGDDEYTLTVASLTSTLPYPVYLIVADDKKEELRDLATTMGISTKILSPKDFGL